MATSQRDEAAQIRAREEELRAAGRSRWQAVEQAHREAVQRQEAAWRAQDPENR